MIDNYLIDFFKINTSQKLKMPQLIVQTTTFTWNHLHNSEKQVNECKKQLTVTYSSSSFSVSFFPSSSSSSSSSSSCLTLKVLVETPLQMTRIGIIVYLNL